MYETTRLAIALRMSRAVMNVTQKRLSEELGVSKTVIARNEKPDMAMRADTLVRLIYVMRQNGIEIDVFSTLDSVRISLHGDYLSAISMRAARAALNLNQQDFADLIGLTKPEVTRSERPENMMRGDIILTLKEKMRRMGVKVDWVPMFDNLTVTVYEELVEAQDQMRQGRDVPGEPTHELRPLELYERLSEKEMPTHHVEERKKEDKDAPE